MCFENEGEWCARIDTKEEKPVESPCWCLECNQDIPIGIIALHVFQQEEEECQCDACQYRDGDEDWSIPAVGCTKDFGQTFEGVVCQDCCKLLKAIRALEIEEGCPEFAQQPLYGELHEVFCDHEQSFEYARKAVEMFPEVRTHRFIERAYSDVAE